VSEKIGNGWVEAEDILEEVKGLKVDRSENRVGDEVGNDGDGSDRRDKNEARRAGDWEMALSTFESTGGWQRWRGGEGV